MDLNIMLAVHTGVSVLVITYLIEVYKLLLQAVAEGFWGSFINKILSLPISFLLLKMSPVDFPLFSGALGNVIGAICISSLASEYAYPITKRLRGENYEEEEEVCEQGKYSL